ncbi:unspecified product [Leptomonas pyrrhocoris]|uniref:Unspecified product n=1 Tax=Leptomonas pyrrhocoris TaxID=157538 RepID=A0A0M9G061_LEPPY|nr:unspecified product [Leptomonas pyrrhocoris]KPA79466.1 unspecified product [Leptomonas pyrrhocoris]|eukprot:XP_015657905.1 unspecified product [Leptomonas pyrrhocoris]
MLRRTTARRASIFGHGSDFARGAAEDWFGRQRSGNTWRGAVTSLVLCLLGIGVVNQFTRGNLMGRAEYESDIVMSFSRTKVPLPDTYGFVDAESAEGQTKPPQRRK